MKRIGLALGGGGARGLAHIKFIEAMDSMGVKPVVISGTSIGSIVGSFYAAGLSGADMANLVSQIGFLELTKMLDVSILNPSGLVKGKGVMDFLSEHIPVNTFEALSIPLKVVATDFWHRREVVFETGDLLCAIRASISVPFVFKPTKIDDVIMTDGGAVNPLPMSVIREDCDILIAIDVSGTNKPPRRNPMPTIFDAVMTTFQIMETAYVENQLTIYKPEIYVKPALTNVQILDFHKDRTIMKSVSKDVDRFKHDLESLLSADLPKMGIRKRFNFFKL